MDRITETGHAWVAGGKQCNLYENTTTPLLTVRMNCLTKREDFC